MFCVLFSYLKRGRGCAAGAAEDHMKRSNHASTYFEKSHRSAPPCFEVPFNKARFPFLAQTGFENVHSVETECSFLRNKVPLSWDRILEPPGYPFEIVFGPFWAPFWMLMGSFWTLLASLGPPWVPFWILLGSLGAFLGSCETLFDPF